MNILELFSLKFALITFYIFILLNYVLRTKILALSLHINSFNILFVLNIDELIIFNTIFNEWPN